MTLTAEQKARLAELEHSVDVSKKVQKDRLEAKNIAYKAWIKARTRYRTRKQITQARERKVELFKERHSNGVKQGVAWALDRVGTTESPPYSNRGLAIDKWNVATLGYSGFAWCQSFANAVLVHGGGPQLKSAYTPQVVQWAREGRYGLKLVSVANRQPGDWQYYKFPGVSSAFCDHVGVYIGNGKSVEGNTSSGSEGSQNNGGGVYLRERGTSQIVAVVRPPYPG